MKIVWLGWVMLIVGAGMFVVGAHNRILTEQSWADKEWEHQEEQVKALSGFHNGYEEARDSVDLLINKHYSDRVRLYNKGLLLARKYAEAGDSTSVPVLVQTSIVDCTGDCDYEIRDRKDGMPRVCKEHGNIVAAAGSRVLLAVWLDGIHWQDVRRSR